MKLIVYVIIKWHFFIPETCHLECTIVIFVSLKPSCVTRFQRTFTAFIDVFKIIILILANRKYFFENATAFSKRTLKRHVATSLYLNIIFNRRRTWWGRSMLSSGIWSLLSTNKSDGKKKDLTWKGNSNNSNNSNNINNINNVNNSNNSNNSNSNNSNNNNNNNVSMCHWSRVKSAV